MMKRLINLTEETLSVQAYDKKCSFIGYKTFGVGEPYSIGTHMRLVKSGEVVIAKKGIISRIINHFYKNTIFLEGLVSGEDVINMSGSQIAFRVRTKSSTDIPTLTKKDYIHTYDLLNEKLQSGHLVIINHSWFRGWYRKDSVYPPNLIDIEELRE